MECEDVNEQQITEFMFWTKGEVAAIWESAKSAHKRIDETGELTASVNQLAREVGRVAEKVEHIADRMDKTVERIEQGQKEQGERISNIEKAILTISRNEKAVEEHEKRLDNIDKAPADKWNKFTWLVFAGVVTAVVAFFVGRFL